MKVLVLVDGEHYPSVTRWGILAAESAGHEAVAALFLGGTEKIDPSAAPDFGLPTRTAGTDLAASLGEVIDDVRPEAVLDLSDEPVAGYRERMDLAAVTLVRGIPYMGPDFRFDPPVSGAPLGAPTVAVIGTGKRTGKTAIAGHLAREAAAAGRSPIVVAMGRGGPPSPQVAQAGEVRLESLLKLIAKGEHAASDYLEDAVTSGVTTIGARRLGGGMAGAPFATNVREAAEKAVEMGAGLVILEGSGAAIPPVPWDSGVLVVPASVPPEYLGGYMGPYRRLLSDLVVFTMAGGPNSGAEHLSALKTHIQRWNEDIRFVVTNFEPAPLGEIHGRSVFLTTTAPPAIAEGYAEKLQATFGCKVVGWSAHLADRARLKEDMDQATEYEVLLTELKAAAVDVASREALDRGAEVVFLDNRAVVVEGDSDLGSLLGDTAALAMERFTKR
ncbi:MAG: 2,3-diphosphoglycerate synthetase [Actinomycetota bacterium]